MNAKVSKLINEQINKEFYSAYLYLDFANYYAAAGLDGFENWYRVQAQEERDHAMLFYQYLQNNGEGVTFEAIPLLSCHICQLVIEGCKGCTFYVLSIQLIGCCLFIITVIVCCCFT